MHRDARVDSLTPSLVLSLILRPSVLLAALALTLAPLLACGGDSNGNGGTTANAVTVTGQLLGRPSSGGQPSGLSSAQVSAHVDKNDNGVIDSGERVETETESGGNFSLEIDADEGDTVVVGFRNSGYAPGFRSAMVGTKGELRFDATLSQIELFECTAGRCAVEDQSLSIAGLPEDFTGEGRTFNPVTEADAFPGDFSDDKGNLLLSGVFSVVELEDGNGDQVDELDNPVDLMMRFPRDTWSIVRDLQSGNNQIDVPMYSFDEVSGEWKSDGEGVLVDSDEEIIPESEIANIRDKSYSGVIYAKASVDHFSTWNVDWPVSTRTTIRGKLSGGGASSGDDPNAGDGVTVTVTGESYAGSSQPTVVAPDGSFCVEVMKSEEPNEDVDQDGKQGETQTVRVRAISKGQYYDLGTVETSRTNSTCDDGTDTGSVDLSLDDSTLLTPEVCTLEVDVELLDGTAVEGASIFAYDSSIPSEVWQELCIDDQNMLFCSFTATTDASGRATMQTPVLTGLYMWGSVSEVNTEASESYRVGTRNVTGCPSNPFTLTLDSGYDWYDLTVSINGSQFTWTPDVGLNWLAVSTGNSSPKWSITGAPEPFGPPVTYGTVPSGARQFLPFDGSSPEALAPGDEVYVYGTDVSEEGYTQIYDGTSTTE